ncbi:MAG: hypothetical protein J0M10_04790 [Chitinophagales bacterium]|nr:hypothetical protein [Chitinophagales bacterium]
MKFRLLTIVFLFALQGNAGVGIRNGVFYMTYTDLSFSGSGTAITRSYQSFNTSTGLFGFGWGSVMETRLFAFPDGSLSVQWWGGGNVDIFEPALQDKQGLYRMIDEITLDEITRDKLENTPVALMKRKAALAADAGMRIQKYTTLLLSKKVSSWIPPSGKTMTWKRNVNQVIEWNGSVFQLRNWRDRYRFSKSGLITEITDEENRISLFYTQEKLSGIRTDEKHLCQVETDSSGKITRLSYTDSTGLHESIYRYDKEDNLVYSKDGGKNEYWYSYDKAHNMTRIGYCDSSYMEIAYDPVNNRAIRVKQRNGAFTSYQYPFFYTPDGKINFLHYATRIKNYDSTGTLVFNEYYEFESRTKPDGEDYLYRRLVQTDTSYEESINDPDVGNAVYRKLNQKEAWQQYDGKARCSRLRINDSIYVSTYNQQDLPAIFMAIDSLKNDSIVYKYTYNSTGDLIKTRRNDSLYTITGSVSSGRIQIGRSGNTLVISFTNGKPDRAEHKDLGILLIESDTVIVNTGKQQALPQTDREKALLLRALYREFSEAMTPKGIAHEWIWERM